MRAVFLELFLLLAAIATIAGGTIAAREGIEGGDAGRLAKCAKFARRRTSRRVGAALLASGQRDVVGKFLFAPSLIVQELEAVGN